MSRAMIPAAPLMLVAGLAIGSAATTLLWQGPMERRGKLIDVSQAQTREAISLANRNLESLKHCASELRRVAGSFKASTSASITNNNQPMWRAAWGNSSFSQYTPAVTATADTINNANTPHLRISSVSFGKMSSIIYSVGLLIGIANFIALTIIVWRRK